MLCMEKAAVHISPKRGVSSPDFGALLLLPPPTSTYSFPKADWQRASPVFLHYLLRVVKSAYHGHFPGPPPASPNSFVVKFRETDRDHVLMCQAAERSVSGKSQQQRNELLCLSLNSLEQIWNL